MLYRFKSESTNLKGLKKVLENENENKTGKNDDSAWAQWTKTKNKKNSFKSETVVVEMKAGLTNQINPCRPEAESDFFVLS